MKHFPNVISFACSFFISPSELVTNRLVIRLLVVELLVVVVLSRHGCKIHKNCKLAEAVLVVGVVARAALVDLIAVGLVF